MRQYIGLVHKPRQSDFGVSFPDFPGCVTAGRTWREAKAMAKEALALHIDGMLADRENIRGPSPLKAALGEPENRNCAWLLIASSAKG